MESKDPVRQRTTSVRKLPTAAPAAAAPPPAPAEESAPAPAARPARPGGVRPGLRPAGAAAAPRKPMGARPAPAAPAGGGSGLKKFLMLFIFLGLGGGIAYGFIRKDAQGVGLWAKVLHKFGIMKVEASPDAKGKETKGPALKVKKPLDLGYDAALAARLRAEAYVKTELAKYDAEPSRITAEIAKDVSSHIKRFGLAMQKGVQDLTKVCSDIAVGAPADIGAAKAGEELEAAKKCLHELGELAKKWKEIEAKAPAEPTAAANPDPKPEVPPEKPKEDPKPEVKPDPKSEPERPPVASGRPVPSGKPAPVKPKEEPKPEPEKPKEEPKPEPKPEPEKPKAEPEKPKAEPEKPKEEPKKPEPDKPKEEPKPEPEKPKEEPKPEPKPEPAKPKVETVLADADNLVKDGVKFYNELGEAMKNLPADAEKLKALLLKKDTATAFFTKARDTYVSVKENAPDPAKIEKRLGQIEMVLTRLQKYEDEIKFKLK